MPPQVTQCPKCRTSFRVTEAQLQIANGAVRCGSCLHIFDATEHWLTPANTRPEPVEPPPPTEEPAPDTPEENSTGYGGLSDELLAISTGEDLDAIPSMPDALKSLDDHPEPALHATIEQRSLDNIFDEESFNAETSNLFEEASSLEELITQNIPADASGESDMPAAGYRSDEDDESDDDLLISDEMKELGGDDGDDDPLIFDNMDELGGEHGDNGPLIADDRDDPDEPRFNDTAQQPALDTFDDLDGDFKDEDFVFADSDDDAEDDAGETGDAGNYSNKFLDIDRWEKHTDAAFGDLDEPGGDTPSKEEEWAQKLLEDEEDSWEAAQEPDHTDAPGYTDNGEAGGEEAEDPFRDIFSEMDSEPEEKAEPDPELMDILNDRDETRDEQPSAEDEFVPGDEPMTAGERIGSEKLALLANIEPEPVIFTGRIDRSKWIRRGWIAASLLALLALGFQYVYFNFDRLARDEGYRSNLATACKLVGCTLPDRDAIDLIRSTNLIVRSHPDVPNALVVDAILTNRAAFKQRFPDMQLLFSNLAGEVIAGRRFSPGEYLQGELAGLSLMPSKQPIHISLEIIDPGPEAVNYQLHFLPPESS